MNTCHWQTMSIEDAEFTLQRGMNRLSRLQGTMQSYEDARIPVPLDIIGQYQSAIDRLSQFADAWGFDIGDMENDRMTI